MPKKIITISTVFFLVFFSIIGTSAAQRPNRSDNQNINWLLRMQVPNDIIPAPAVGRSGLVLSHNVPDVVQTYAQLYDRAHIYDNALAAIALTLSGKFVEAKNILTALAGLTDSEGKLGIFYNTLSSGFEAVYRTGPIAWVGYALVFYQRAAQDNQFQNTAKRIADWIMTMLNPTVGSVRGGPDVVGFPTDHNIAAFFFLRDFGRLTKERAYFQAVNRIKRSLLMRHWSRENHSFKSGIGNGSVDLRSASWGALFSLSVRQPQRAMACLRFIEKNLRTRVTPQVNDKPNDKSIEIFGYKPKIGDNINFIWSEGSLAVALIYKRNRNWKRFQQIVRNIAKMRRHTGGIMYAFPAAGDIPSWESTASTAWMALVLSMRQGAFWSGFQKLQKGTQATEGTTTTSSNTTSKSRGKKSIIKR